MHGAGRCCYFSDMKLCWRFSRNSYGSACGGNLCYCLPSRMFSWECSGQYFCGTSSAAKKSKETYSGPSRTSKMDLFVKIVNSFQLVTIFAKSSILDVQLGFEYVSELKQFNFRLCNSSEALFSLLPYKVLHFNQLCGFFYKT